MTEQHAIYTCTTNSGELKVRLRVLETRKAYGRKDYLVTPVSGSGEAWVSESSLVFEEEAGE